jgi:hypothetical protein
MSDDTSVKGGPAGGLGAAVCADAVEIVPANAKHAPAIPLALIILIVILPFDFRFLMQTLFP